MDLTHAFARTQGQEENSLEGQSFQKEAFSLVRMEPLSAGVASGRSSGGDTPPPFGSVSVETIQETSEILIFADVNG